MKTIIVCVLVIFMTNFLNGQVIVNEFKKGKCVVNYSPDYLKDGSWIPYRDKEPTVEAAYFPYTDQFAINNKIKEVRLFVRNFKSTPTYFNVRILNSTNDHNPGQDLIETPLRIEVTDKEELIKINLEKYNITIPEQGIFVGIELLKIPENSLILRSGQDSTTIYSPFLCYMETNENEYKYWIYSNNEWISNFKKVPNYTKREKNLYYKPAISLVL